MFAALDIRVSGNSDFEYSAWFTTASINETVPSTAVVAGVSITKQSANTIALNYPRGNYREKIM